MGIEEVKRFFREKSFPGEVVEHEQSTATVEKAAATLGVAEKLIAKTLVFKQKDDYFIIVTRGDARIDNKKLKQTFQKKATMLKPAEILELTGHPVGGVCPFGLKNPVDIYLDESLQAFDYIFPAAGAPHASVKITPAQLQQVTGGTWIDVCQ